MAFAATAPCPGCCARIRRRPALAPRSPAFAHRLDSDASARSRRHVPAYYTTEGRRERGRHILPGLHRNENSARRHVTVSIGGVCDEETAERVRGFLATREGIDEAQLEARPLGPAVTLTMDVAGTDMLAVMADVAKDFGPNTWLLPYEVKRWRWEGQEVAYGEQGDECDGSRRLAPALCSYVIPGSCPSQAWLGPKAPPWSSSTASGPAPRTFASSSPSCPCTPGSMPSTCLGESRSVWHAQWSCVPDRDWSP